jgi:hypothetical protein
MDPDHSGEQRRVARLPMDDLNTEIRTATGVVQARILDVSEHGMRIAVPAGAALRTDEEIIIGIGKVARNIRGRVRWADWEQRGGKELVLGVEFGDFVVEPRKEDEVQDLLAAWQEVSRSYSVYDSFLRILELLDSEILDGKITDLSDAVFSIAAWTDRQLGPLNVWSVLQDGERPASLQLVAERHPLPGDALPTRRSAVAEAHKRGVALWTDGRPYLRGGNIVVEYLGADQTHIDLLQKLAVQISNRIPFWSKVLMKNMALQLFAELRDAALPA